MHKSCTDEAQWILSDFNQPSVNYRLIEGSLYYSAGIHAKAIIVINYTAHDEYVGLRYPF